jgi:hypothetical protein
MGSTIQTRAHCDLFAHFRKHANLLHVAGNGQHQQHPTANAATTADKKCVTDSCHNVVVNPRLSCCNGCWQDRKDSKKLLCPTKLVSVLRLRSMAAFKKKMAKRKDRREAAAAQAALQGPLTKEGSLAEVSLQAEDVPVVVSNVVLQSKNKRSKALKVLLGPFKHVKIPKISKEQRAQKKTVFKIKCQSSRALTTAAEAESTFPVDTHSVSRFVGLDSDCVSESLSREPQSGYIWKGGCAQDFCSGA